MATAEFCRRTSIRCSLGSQFLHIVPPSSLFLSRSPSLSSSIFAIYSTAHDSTIALLGAGHPITASSSLCDSVGTARLSLTRFEFNPSRYLRSTCLCGWRGARWCCFEEEALVDGTGFAPERLRSSLGRPRLGRACRGADSSSGEVASFEISRKGSGGDRGGDKRAVMLSLRRGEAE